MKTITEMTNMQNLNQSNTKCPVCGGLTSNVYDFIGKKRRVPIACKCKVEEYERLKQLDKDRERQIRAERIFKSSMMGEEFKNATFENFEKDEYNRKYLKMARSYVSRWKEMKEKNIGILLMGNTGVGKSHISFMIANEIMTKYMSPVIAISTIELINKIYDSYSKYGEQGETEIIRSLQNADLLVLDDIGAESKSRNGKEKQIIYNLIDSRLRDGKPMILTTNLNTNQLREKLKSEDMVERTYDRLIAMCSKIEIEGNSRRIQQGKEKADIIKSLL